MNEDIFTDDATRIDKLRWKISVKILVAGHRLSRWVGPSRQKTKPYDEIDWRIPEERERDD